MLHQAGTITLDGDSYTYDNAGNRITKTNSLNSTTENYSYDPIYQLTQVTQGLTTTESYTYDAVGNRLSSLGMSPYAYNSSNELTSTPEATFAYDANGNTLTKVDSSGTTTYGWDFENRLGSVALPGGAGTVTFKYDPFGRRIQKSSPTGTTNYFYDGANSVEELDQTGAELAHYSQGAGIDAPLAAARGGAIGFYEQDGLASVTSLTDLTGAVLNSYTYDAYGNVASATGSFANPYQFTGRDYDSETGLRYYRARYYDAIAGRFLSEDRLRFDATNTFYAYVGSSPTNLRDPSGLLPPNDNVKPWELQDVIITLLKDDDTGCACWLNKGKLSKIQLIDVISHIPILLYQAPAAYGGETSSDPQTPIWVNTNGPFYSKSPYSVGHAADGSPIYDPGSFEARVVILLHELAHKALPQGFISHDADLIDNTSSEKNTNLVIEHCKYAIRYLKFLFNGK